jgi:hypothetical protein
MKDLNVNPVRTKDGRYAEERISKLVDADACSDVYVSEEVKEVWEEERPLVLKERVREIKKPMVVERIVETIDGDEVVERKVESVDGSPMRLVDHVGLANPQIVSAQSSNDCMSREEAEARFSDLLKENHSHMSELVEGLKGSLAKDHSDDEDWDYDDYEESNVSMQSVVEDNVKSQKSWGVVEWVLLGVIGVEVAYVFVNMVLPNLR